MRYSAAILVALLVLAVVLTAGCTGTSSSSPGASSSSPGSDVKIQVSYSGDWSGSYGDLSGQSSVDGSGPRTITVEDAKSVVSAVFQKRDAGTGELRVVIMKDGKVLKSGSTTAVYGVVSVSTTL